MVILPGNHDPFMPGSAYTRADLGANVRVLSTPGGETCQLAELDLDIWGRPHCGYEDFRPHGRTSRPAAGPPGRSPWRTAT